MRNNLTFPSWADRQKGFEGNLWNVFNALGSGYKVFLSPNNKEVRLIPPSNSTDFEFLAEKEVIQNLIDNGLIKEDKNPKAFIGKQIQYVLTEKGKDLYDELAILDDSEFRNVFIERINPERKIAKLFDEKKNNQI